jgi:surface antigen
MSRNFLSAALVAASLMVASTPAVALQCVPYARETSGIELYGNAKTWWGQAAGRYDRGSTPKVGAVMAFKPTARMRIGHVATVTQIVSDREVLISHANWSLINGRRGQIERNVRAIDVSAAGDWSQVKVWYAPLLDLGTTSYPLYGFIYSRLSDVAPQSPREPLKLGSDIARLAALEAER